jgi:hypothetical protein
VYDGGRRPLDPTHRGTPCRIGPWLSWGVGRRCAAPKIVRIVARGAVRGVRAPARSKLDASMGNGIVSRGGYQVTHSSV